MCRHQRVIQRHVHDTAATLRITATACMVHKTPPDDLRTERQTMQAALAPDSAGSGRRQERISGPFTVSLAITPGQGSCAGNFAVEAHGLGQTARGPMFLTIKKCFFPASKTYAGIFALCPSDALCSPDSDNAISGTYAGGAD